VCVQRGILARSGCGHAARSSAPAACAGSSLQGVPSEGRGQGGGSGAWPALPAVAQTGCTQCCVPTGQHVRGGVVPPKGAPHLKSHLLPLQRQALIRFRVGSYPLRIATGRNEGDGSANAQPGRARGTRRIIARQPRTCRVCGVAWAVEDMQHFLLECSSYARVRQSWLAAFGQQATLHLC